MRLDGLTATHRKGYVQSWCSPAELRARVPQLGDPRRASPREILNPVVVGAVGSVGNSRPHAGRAGCAPGGRGLSKRLWAARSAVQGDGGQVVGSALGSAAGLAPAPPGAVHELSTGAVSRGTPRGKTVKGTRVRSPFRHLQAGRWGRSLGKGVSARADVLRASRWRSRPSASCCSGVKPRRCSQRNGTPFS